MEKMVLSKWYTRVVGVFFILVSISLIFDFINFGFRAETMHKIFHVLLGLFIVYYGWNSKSWHKYFPVINGLFFTFVASFGFLFPDFADLDAFNKLDTLLHSIVGLFGLVIAFIDRK